MSLEILEKLCGMIKINKSFAGECQGYFSEMSDIFASIPIIQKQNAGAQIMIQNIEDIVDDRPKADDQDILGSTNIKGEYYKSKRSVVEL